MRWHFLVRPAVCVSLVCGQATREADTGPAMRANSDGGAAYVWIPAGTFRMGCSPADLDCHYEAPVHSVTISRGFWLRRTPVTVSAYKRFAAAASVRLPLAGAMNPGWRSENHPIANVSWDDAANYCAWAGGRLPSEAEWEYAARGGSADARYGDLDAVAWFKDNSGRGRNGPGTHPVGLKLPNAFGLYDMLGNVTEWTADWYDAGYYSQSPSQDPRGPSSGRFRVLRGGSWFDAAGDVRVSRRDPQVPASAHAGSGFRCVWEENEIGWLDSCPANLRICLSESSSGQRSAIS